MAMYRTLATVTDGAGDDLYKGVDALIAEFHLPKSWALGAILASYIGDSASDDPDYLARGVVVAYRELGFLDIADAIQAAVRSLETDETE